MDTGGFKIECETNGDEINNFTGANHQEQDIIILDDDDFIQTTFNLLSSTNASSSAPITSQVLNPNLDLESPVVGASGATNVNFDNPNQNDQQQSILIDLTSGDDFDLNDLFLIHSNSVSQFNNTANNQNSSQSNTNQNEDEIKSIKNEFDFKAFNFNFGSSIEEILIDDDDEALSEENEEESINLINGYDLNKQNELNDLNLLATASSSQPTTSTSAFLKYRSNDSSSEASSSIKSTRIALFKCEYCDKTFNKSYNYKRHLFLHESKTSENSSSNSSGGFFVNECSKCKRRILDKSNYAKHVKICYHKAVKKIKLFSYPSANHCSEASANPIAEQSDSTEISSSKLKHRGFQCEICSKMFNKKFNFHRHIRMHFLNEIMNHQHDPLNYVAYEKEQGIQANAISSSLDAKIEFFQCDKCSRKFNEHKQLVLHKHKWHLTEFECKYCTSQDNASPVKFTEKFEYIKHLNAEHSIKFKFECKYCFKHFRYLSHYIQHKRSHLIKNSTLNYQINNKLNSSIDESSSNELNNEELDKLHCCEYCGKQFSKLFNLKRHVNTRHQCNNAENDANLVFVSNENSNLESVGSQSSLMSLGNASSVSQLDSGMRASSENESTGRANKKSKNNSESSSGGGRVRLKYDCNLNQKNFYERNKLNFHLNKVQINK